MVINDRYLEIFDKLQKYNYIYGGSSSAKTYSIVQYIVLCMMKGEACLVMRATQTSIKKTIYNDFSEIIENAGLADCFEINKSFPLRIKSNIGTGECLFLGADKNADDNKGVKPANGAGKFTIFYGDECDQIPKSAVMQMRIRIRGISSTGATIRYIYSFNPTFRQHYLFDDFIVPAGFDPYRDWDMINAEEQTLVARMTYKDNQFLEQDEIDELENLGKQSKYYKQVYLDAEPGVLGKKCIESFEVIKAEDVPNEDYFRELGGMDHGFNDPFCGVWGKYDEDERVLYITNELYGSELSIEYIAENIPHDIPFTADSSHPLNNSMLEDLGVIIDKAKKPSGSVFGGIMFLNMITVKIVETCTNTIIGFTNYSWKLDDRTGNTIDEPNHDFSHPVDAVRYMMEGYSMAGGVMSFGARKN